MIWYRDYFIFFLLITLLGCKKNHHLEQTHNNTGINSKISFPWFEYIDSTMVFRSNSPVVDSLMFCFLKEDAPSVLEGVYILFWKNGKIVDNDNQCLDGLDGYFEISSGHYIAYVMGRRSIYLNEIAIHKSIECSNKKYFDFTKADPCLEVHSLKKDTIKGNLVYIKATMEDICFKSVSDTILTFRINR